MIKDFIKIFHIKLNDFVFHTHSLIIYVVWIDFCIRGQGSKILPNVELVQEPQDAY